uniref:CAP N-terminal domain-containing protein n=1 Tax=Hanusia phi TaxID=3032 RepID=A0A7S0EXV3_9CRYP
MFNTNGNGYYQQFPYTMQSPHNVAYPPPTSLHEANYMSPGHVYCPQVVQQGVASPVVDCWRFPGYFFGLPFAGYVEARPVQAALPPERIDPKLAVYDKLVAKELKEFLESCQCFATPLRKQAQAVNAAFQAQRVLLDHVSKVSNPSSSKVHEWMLPIDRALLDIEGVKREGCVSSPEVKHHLQMVAGAMTALSWVTVKDPVAYISDALNALPVFANKIEENQEPENKKLVDKLKLLLRALRSFVAEHYQQGLFGKQQIHQEMTSKDTEKMYDREKILRDYDELVMDKMSSLVEVLSLQSEQLKAYGQCVDEAFRSQREMLVAVASGPKPSDEDFERLLVPTSEALAKISKYEESSGRHTKHLKMILNGMEALAWVTLPNPAAFVSEIVNCIPVFANQIVEAAKRRQEKLKHKEQSEEQGAQVDEKHQDASYDIQIVSNFKHMMRGLLLYVRTHHADGLNWNISGEQAPSVSPKTGRVRVEA